VKHSLLLLALLSTNALADIHGRIGLSSRQDAMDTAIGYGPVEIEYIDFGEQPNTSTHNRAVNLNLFHKYKMVWGKVGLTSTYFSDPYNNYDWDKSFKGWNAGVGAEYKGWYAQLTNLHYQQCSQDKMNDYLYWSVGYSF